jgi:DNA-binding transcriptional regulator YdaS (Cro superfamily)
MHLRTYLEKTDYENEPQSSRYSRFAKQLGVSLHTVYKWLNGSRRIKDSMKLKIEETTSGKVTVRDLVQM